MALNIILSCLVAVSALNFVLIYDLYGRSTRIAAFTEAVRKQQLLLARLLHTLNPTE